MAKAAGAARAKPKLLSGGNPQIPKGYGDEPVQAYIAAMPGWKSELGRRIDTLIEKTVPGVRKAVKWNSPFYGLEDDLWFLSFHVFTNYVKVTFLRGASLEPPPPGKLAEGRFTAPVLAELAASQGVDMPVSNAVAAILAGKITIDAAIEGLLTRPFKAEE